MNEIIIISTLCVFYKLTTAVTARRGPPGDENQCETTMLAVTENMAASKDTRKSGYLPS